MRCELQILGLDVSLTGPDAIVAPIAFAYRRFVVERPLDLAPGTGLRIRLGPGGLSVDGRSRPLVAGLDPRLQLYQSLLGELMQRFESHFVLHAAALRCPDGGVLLLAAPSGHGKSTLTLELVRRGLGFMSDDYAPLDPLSGRISPYPRAVGVIPGGGERLPAALVEAAGCAAPELFGKRLVDVGLALGDETLARDAGPLRRVVLLGSTGETDAPVPTRIELAARHDAGTALERRIAALDGVTILESRAAPPLYWIGLEIEPGARVTDRIEPLLESDDVLFFEKSWVARPDFDVEPQALPIARRVAAEHLGRELLNRRPGGRLLARHDGRLASLFFELARALRDVECIELRVGRFESTASLVERIAHGALDGTPTASPGAGGRS